MTTMNNEPAAAGVTEWSFEENKRFENAIAELGVEAPLSLIASRVPGKTLDQVQDHHHALITDIEMIESGAIAVPDYERRPARRRRRRGIIWSPEEHQLFLEGLDKYGKGDWRSISRFSVLTRSPTQVASHAQKYFLRIASDPSLVPPNY